MKMMETRALGQAVYFALLLDGTDKTWIVATGIIDEIHIHKSLVRTNIEYTIKKITTGEYHLIGSNYTYSTRAAAKKRCDLLAMVREYE